MLTRASYPVGCRFESNWNNRPSFPPPVIILPSFDTQMVKIDPSCTFLTILAIVLDPTTKITYSDIEN